MNIDELNTRYNDLITDTNKALFDGVKKHDGVVAFISEGDEALEEIDDLSELGLPLVHAHSYNYGSDGYYYITSLCIRDNKLEIYGVGENNCCGLDDEQQLNYLSLGGLLDVLACITD